MFITKNKTIAIAFAILLSLSMTASMILLPSVSAHTPGWDIPTYAFISIQPNPVGLGQAVFVNFWIDKVSATANSQYGDRWQNYTVTITQLSTGTVTKLGPFKADDAGGAETTWTPPAIGNYTAVFNFPGQKIVGANPSPISGTTNAQSIGDYYEPSTSRTCTFVVDQTQVGTIPSTPLPTGYWQTPIIATNTVWYSISGNWLFGGAQGNSGDTYNSSSNFDPYSLAPTTGHIVWTMPYASTPLGGGLIGGQYGGNEISSNYYSTSQYESKFSAIIMNGVLYYTKLPGASTSLEGWVAVDLRTGQTLWTQTPETAGIPGANTTIAAQTSIRLGQLMDYVSPNQFGALAYLWAIEPTVPGTTGTTYGMLDAATGNWILNIVNGQSPTWVSDAQGDLLGYYLTSNNMLTLWNSTQAIMDYSNTTKQNTNWWEWRPAQGQNIPWADGIMWSVPIQLTMKATNGTTVNINTVYSAQCGVTTNLAIGKISDNIILIEDIPGPTTSFQQPGYIVCEGYSEATGALLWGPQNDTQASWCRLSLSSVGDGVFTVFTYETQTIDAYSLTTGTFMWSANIGTYTAGNDPWGYYITASIIGYGSIYVADFGGYVLAFNVTTGTCEWTWNTGTAGYNTPYGIYTICNILTLADGQLYLMGGHEYSPPLYNGGSIYDINVTSGTLLWKEPNFSISNSAECGLADGYLVVPNAYTNLLYCYGQGLSATTVTTSPGINDNNQVLISGTVTDQSPGQTCLGIPAAGTPAISDASMSAWMNYLYFQQPMPTNATGVPVTLTYIDPNNNTYTIGTTTSDITGHYAYTFTPTIPGKYTITATFAGSGSYFGSTAETTILYNSPPVATATPTATPTSVANMYFVPMSIVIIIVIIVGFALLAVLALRKRP